MSTIKITYLFGKLPNKSYFKENRFIFDSAETPNARAKAEAAAKAKEEEARKIETEYQEKAAKLRAEASEIRQKAGIKVANEATTTVEDEIDKTLKNLDQKGFDNFLDSWGSLEKDLSESQIDTLVRFAEWSKDKAQNIDAIFRKFESDSHFKAQQLSTYSIKTFFENYKNNEKNLKVLFEKLLFVTTETTGRLFDALKNHDAAIIRPILSPMVESGIKNTLSENSKAELLADARIPISIKTMIADSLFNAKSGELEKFDPEILESWITFHVIEKNGERINSLKPNFNDATIAKLTAKAAQTLLTKLDKDSNKDFHEKISKRIEDIEKAKKTAKEKQAETKTQEEFTSEMSTDEVLEKAIGLTRKGKSVSWTFEITDGDKTIQSNRSFLKSKRFLNVFQEFRDAHKKGVSANQVKEFCYKWLWEKVYKSGKKKRAIGNVIAFEKSQEILTQRIDELKNGTDVGNEPPAKDGEEKSAAGDKIKDTTGKDEPEAQNKKESTKAETKEPLKITKLPAGIADTDKSKIEKLIPKITNDFDKALRTGTNIFEIIAALKTLGRKLGGILKGELEMQFTDQTSKEIFDWSSKIAENNGFGSRTELINKILAVKRIELGGEYTEDYTTFHMQSRIAQIEVERENTQTAKLKEYREKYKEFTSKVYIIDYRIGDLSEEDMADKFDRFDGHGGIERIMGKPPFSVPQRRTGLVAAKIISEDDNDRIYFEDIFEYSKFLPGFKTIAGEGKIDKDLLENADDLLKKYEELVAKKDNPELEAYMFEKLIGPCIELLNAISKLRYEKNNTSEYKDPIEIAQKSIPEDQLPIIKSLQSLFNYSQDTSNCWEDFLGWISGAKKITMANMDGTTFDVDQGMFQRHFDPKAALFTMLEKPGLYTVENGQKKINEEALLNTVNDLMLRGYITRELGKLKAKNGKPASPQEVTELRNKMISDSGKYQIQSLKGQNFTKDQMLAFQLGFLSTEIAENEEKVSKGMDNYLNEVFKGEQALEPGERKILLEIIKQQGKVKAEYLREIRPKLKEAGERLKEYVASKGKISTNLIHGHFHFDQDGNLVGGGIAIPFTLSDGATLTIGLGAAKGSPGGVFAGLDFSIKIAGGKGWNVSHFSSVSIMGAATGFRGNHEIGEGVDLWWMAGLSASWQDVMNIGVGAGIGVSYDKWLLKHQEERAQGSVAEESGWNKETLKKWPSLSVDEKYALLEKSPQWNQIQIVLSTYSNYLNKENLVRAYDREMERLAGEVHKTNESSIPSLIPVGIGVGAIAPALITALAAGNPVLGIALGLIAGAKFRLGTVEIFIPHPKEEQNILALASDANARAQVEKLLAEIMDGTSQLEFNERTPDVYWRPGSGLGKGIRIENKEINLTNIRTDFETYNEALKKGDVDIRLQKHPDGKIEMNIDNLFNKDRIADKDLEVHIDPSLYALGIVADDGKLFIEGNIDDLIITRERFRFSHLQANGRSSIRDVITIRQKSSIDGKQKIDRQWLQEFEPYYLEILTGQKTFRKEDGLNPGAGYGNIQMLKDFAAMPAGWETRPELKPFYDHRPESMKKGNEGKIIDKDQVEKYHQDIKQRHEALGAVSKEAFEKEKPREGFKEKMRKLFIDPDFHEKFGEIVDQPGKVIDFVKTYTDSHKEFGLNGLSHKEITLAENILRDLWFTTAYRAEGSLDKLELDKSLVSKLKKAGFKNISNLDILTVVDIKDIFTRKKIAITDEEAAKIVDVVQKFKEKPLSNEELIEKNKQLKKRLELVRDYCTSKFVDAFNDVIGKMTPPLSNANAEDIVKNHFMKGVYEGILSQLSNTTNPIDFRKIDIEKIPTGSDLISGTRINKGGERIKALSHTLFEQPEKSEVQIHDFGFLNGTTKEYKLSDSGVNKDIARILLEIASPILKEDTDLLKSTFAIKILGLGVHRLIANNEEYQLITELCKDPSKASDEKYKAALLNFRKMVEDIRKSQHESGVFTHKSDKGYTVTVDMVKETAIKSGAYTQCTNPSFYVNEKGIAKVPGQKRGIVAVREDITQITNAVTDLASVTFSLSGGVTMQRKPAVIPPSVPNKPAEPTPEPKPEGGVHTEVPLPAAPDGTPHAPSANTGDAPPAGYDAGLE